jgi:hypothetical protein
MTVYVAPIVIAVCLGVLVALHVLYQTRRIGPGWLAALACVALAGGAYIGMFAWAKQVPQKSGAVLGSDEHIAAPSGPPLIGPMSDPPPPPRREERACRDGRGPQYD